MNYLWLLLGLQVVLTLGLLVVGSRAPEGYEDENGFQFGDGRSEKRGAGAIVQAERSAGDAATLRKGPS